MNYKLFFFWALFVSFTSCAAVKGIFKAGFWVGAVIVIVIVVIAFLLFGKKKE